MSFDEYQKSDNAMCMNNDYNRKIYEAGAASRQGEIDELQRLLSDSLSLEESESIKFKMQANELHKRIDLALEKCYTGIRKQGGDYYLVLVEDILKGGQS